jgi:hypothetical protein
MTFSPYFLCSSVLRQAATPYNCAVIDFFTPKQVLALKLRQGFGGGLLQVVPGGWILQLLLFTK